MNVVLVTDAWHPQFNGVVQTWTYMVRELEAMGHRVHVISPQGAKTVAAPGEPDMHLALNAGSHVAREWAKALGDTLPDALHIATEGPLGWAARRWALRRGWSFTTSYHTRFPEYLARRYRIPAAWTYPFMRRFHRPSQRVLVPTAAMRDELAAAGIGQLTVWARGVDTERFVPTESAAQRDAVFNLPRPIWLNVGRIAPEKGIEDFLALDLPGSKVVLGAGPALARLQAQFPAHQHPHIHWLPQTDHARLQPYYAAADVFVFPSRTDTFGLVMLEANACGTPVAAFPVTGPIDVVQMGVTGVLDPDLRQACLAALKLDRTRVRAAALSYRWRAIAEQLAGHFVPLTRTA